MLILKFLKRFGILLFILIIILLIIVILYLQHPMFGAKPKGERLEKIEKSKNYHDGQFWNISDTPLMTQDENGENNVSMLSWFKSDKEKRLVPDKEIPSVKTDLKSLPKNENTLVWLGHSAYFMILDGKTYLVDPTLITGSPVWFVNKPFPGTDIFKPDDIPEIDYLIISHDHYDHLDYFTIKELKNKIGKIISPLGIGAHFERWGFDSKDIIELDWYEDFDLENNVKISCLPARHYGGRLFNQNNTLWASFMLETETKTVYIGGDSGYDNFFKEIGEKWKNIDLAILENGQYDQQWKYIHMLPDDLIKAIKDLNAKKIFTVHNSKYSISNHSWDDPMINLDERLQKEGINTWITPILGEIVNLEFDNGQTFTKRWKLE